MPTKITTPVIACLGDSLTLGGTGTVDRPWPQRSRLNLAPTHAVGNQGLSGDTIAGMAARYVSAIQGRGFAGVVLMGGINDIQGGATGASILATYTSLVNQILGDGLPLVCVTTSPFGNHAAWNLTKQGHLNILRAGILALTGTGLQIFDGYTFMGETLDPTKLKAAYDLFDGLHWSQVGCEAFAAAILPYLEAML